MSNGKLYMLICILGSYMEYIYLPNELGVLKELLLMPAFFVTFTIASTELYCDVFHSTSSSVARIKTNCAYSFIIAAAAVIGLFM